MRFRQNHVDYALDFVRRTEKVYVREGKDEAGRKVFIELDSKHPSTEARVLKVEKGKRVGEWEVVASAKVICYYKDSDHHDKFSLEDGRQWALKKLTPKLPRELRGKVWDAYLQRGHAKLAIDTETVNIGEVTS